MLRRSLAAVSALTAIALLATTTPASVSTAGELKAEQKKRKLLVPAVMKIRDAAARVQKAKPGTVQAQTCKGSWDRCNPQVVRAKKRQSGKTGLAPPGSVRFLHDPLQ